MSDESTSRTSLIGAIKTPLGFFGLANLVAEAVLLALLANAEGTDRTLGIVGMILLLLASGGAVCFLAYRRADALGAQTSDHPLPQSLGFEQVISEIASAIEKLQRRESELFAYYRKQGDAQRLLDGLYSGLLYASSAVPTGSISPLFYGNLSETNRV